MIRIYITDNGVEGYNEGCSCCSSREPADLDDVENLISELENQIKRLKLLSYLIEQYGEKNLIAWKIQFDDIENLKRRVEAAIMYENDNSIQGTFYRDCFETRERDLKLLKVADKTLGGMPNNFKKYYNGVE